VLNPWCLAFPELLGLLDQPMVSDTVVTVHCWAVAWAGMASRREAIQALLEH